MESILALKQPQRKTTLDPSLSTRLDEDTLADFDALAQNMRLAKLPY